jgi:protein-L-isoaspartate O-methyltransferase
MWFTCAFFSLSAVADGMEGLPSRCPYDRIIVGAAIPCIPRPLIDQMAPGGIMVAPLGDKSGGTGGQNLTVFSKSESGVVTTEAVMGTCNATHGFGEQSEHFFLTLFDICLNLVGVRFAPLQTVEEQMRAV